MSLSVKKVDAFPPLVRGGASKNAEENRQIQELLNQVGTKHMVENIPSKKEYNSLQQRIRTAANRLGIKVSIQWSESENALYFKSEKIEVVEAPKTEVKSK